MEFLGDTHCTFCSPVSQHGTGISTVWRCSLLLEMVMFIDFPSSHVCLPYVSRCSTCLFTSMNIQAPPSSISPQNNFGVAFSKCTMFSVYAIQGVRMIPSCQQGSQVKIIPKVCSNNPSCFSKFHCEVLTQNNHIYKWWDVLPGDSARSVSPWQWDDRSGS